MKTIRAVKKAKAVIEIGKNTSERIDNVSGAVEFLGDTFGTACVAAVHPGSIRWKSFRYYLSLCGSQSLPIVLLLCYLMGLIIAFQAGVQMQKYGAEMIMADMVAYSIFKELGPLMVAIIATGRAGSSFAAEIGTMTVDEEISALETMGISPNRFLVLPKLAAMVLALPMLTIFGDISGVLGGATVGVYLMDIPAVTYFDRTREVLDITVFLMGLSKAVIFAVLISLSGCRKGFLAQDDALGVGRAATGAVVSSIFLIVVADAVLTVIFWFWGY